MSRRDGWPALRDRYQLPQQDVRGLDHDLAYRALADGSLDVTDLYATDAEIRAYQLRVLVDDRRHFPDYDAVLVYRLDARARAPAAFAALDRLVGAIDAPTMIALNARVKLDGADERQAAAAWLRTALGVAAPAAGRAGRSPLAVADHARAPAADRACRCWRRSPSPCRWGSCRRAGGGWGRWCWRRWASSRPCPRWRCWCS